MRRKSIIESMIGCFIVCCMAAGLMTSVVCAQEIKLPHPTTYIPSQTEIEKHKKPLDDPRPVLLEWPYEKILPKELYELLTYDVGKMKEGWAEVIGFNAPEVVGKVHPEIKPGKYTYKDVQDNPAFKELMPPILYMKMMAPERPNAAVIPEFEIIPTRQYYWSLPVIEATKKNIGKTKLDDQGYVLWQTWEGGVPFPRPSGPLKARQVMTNFERRYMHWGKNMYCFGYTFGINSRLKLDLDGVNTVKLLTYMGRVLAPPYGWYDQRAKDQGELTTILHTTLSPRDVAGSTMQMTLLADPRKTDRSLVYIPSLRRVRKLTTTDTQDPYMGMDTIVDDFEGLYAKLTPDRYPYKIEVVEKEYLVLAPTIDGAEYFSSKDWTLRNARLERRPVYEITMHQLDKSYVYSKRILYIDRETFCLLCTAMYDQKGRLYRTIHTIWSFAPKMGSWTYSGGFFIYNDFVDNHATLYPSFLVPAFWNREDMSIENAIKKIK